MSRYFAVVPAAGFGQRFGGGLPKQYQQINSKPLLWYSLKTLTSITKIEQVAVIISANDNWFDSFTWDFNKLSVLRCGGATRALSVRQGIAQLQQSYQLKAEDWLLVHDAARCCLSVGLVERLIVELNEDSIGGLLALPVADTIKRADSSARVAQTIAREKLWLAQTPQMFRYGILNQAMQSDRAGLCTDEAAAVEALGKAPRLVDGEATNFKVTYPQDILLASAILSTAK